MCACVCVRALARARVSACVRVCVCEESRQVDRQACRELNGGFAFWSPAVGIRSFGRSVVVLVVAVVCA